MNKIEIILAVVIFFIYSHFINKYLHSVGHEYYNDEDRVYDVFHEMLPNYEKYEFIGNVYICIVLLLVFLKPSLSFSIILDFISFIIPIYFIRSILTLITVLPKSSNCEYNLNMAFVNGGCYDKIFSGHTAMVFILSLLLKKYKVIDFTGLIILNIINVSIILLTRTHYTIDIIVSFLVCVLMYKNNIRL
jgi:hypothetical protein